MARFKPWERLKKEKEIESLFDKSNSLVQKPFKVLWNIIEQPEHFAAFVVKVAISVPKKSFKKAVTRNKLKRRFREAYRINKSLVYAGDGPKGKEIRAFFIYTAKEELSYKEIEEAVILILKKLGK